MPKETTYTITFPAGKWKVISATAGVAYIYGEFDSREDAEEWASRTGTGTEYFIVQAIHVRGY
jgi:hypothetical protein